jgi:membrane-bound lytic murein transglycosylase D
LAHNRISDMIDFKTTSFKIDASNFLAIASIIILFGYITYNETSGKGPNRSLSSRDSFSDDGVAPAEISMEEYAHPLQAISFDVPKNITFAGEKVPLKLPDVKERLDKELQINTYLHSNTLFLIKRANRWLPQIEKILRKHDIPDDFKYLPLIESNLLNVISPANAVGYWQILKTSGKEFGLEISNEVDERYDPLKATEAACLYLKKSYEKFGNWTLVAASYNRGMTGVENALKNQHVNSYYDLYLNDETSRYVFRILAIKEIILNSAKYGFKVNPKHLEEIEPLRYVEVNQTIEDLVAFSQRHGINYKLLKRHNPWLREEKLTVRKGKTYRIAIPV